jgi:hypothetical protein
MPAQSTVTPVDQDLQNLYDEVWAGFADESPSADGDLDNIYNVYSSDSEYPPTPTANSPISPPSAAPCAYLTPRHVPRD